MPPIPKPPASCANLDLAVVKRVLTKHFGDIPRAAKELGLSGPDLNRLTWAKPKLLEEAEDRRGEVIARAWGQLIEALYSDDSDRQMWASDKILSSWLARDHPLAPARRGRGVEAPQRQVTFRWDSAAATDVLERDGQTLQVPRYGGDLGECLEVEVVRPPSLIETPPSPVEAPPALIERSVEPAAPTPSPPPLPKLPRWPGPHAPPPLVANRYAPWSPPRLKARPRSEPQPEPEDYPQLGLRPRLSRGGYRR